VETIIILALVFAFVAMRLYSVLGKRTGHEQPIAKPIEAPVTPTVLPRANGDAKPQQTGSPDVAVDASARDGVRAIAAADPHFDPTSFLGGAQAAYRMVLEAFWAGDEDAIRGLADEGVVSAFAMPSRSGRAAGLVLENRLVAIERALISARGSKGRPRVSPSASMRTSQPSPAMPRVSSWQARSAMPSRPTTSGPSRAMSRAPDPNWTLIETDEAA
jgi:predicted lipid-binding transport protein (Tim44 family)